MTNTMNLNTRTGRLASVLRSAARDALILDWPAGQADEVEFRLASAAGFVESYPRGGRFGRVELAVRLTPAGAAYLADM